MLSLQTQFTIQESHFSEVLPYWKNELWPLRKSTIADYSIIDSNGELTLDKGTLVVHFIKAVDASGQIIGVNSCIKVSADQIRSRGLWVNKAYQKLGLGRSIMNEIEKIGQRSGCKKIWSMPRESSIGFYLKCGFEIYKTTDQYEYGPHFLVEKKLT